MTGKSLAKPVSANWPAGGWGEAGGLRAAELAPQDAGEFEGHRLPPLRLQRQVTDEPRAGEIGGDDSASARGLAMSPPTTRTAMLLQT